MYAIILCMFCFNDELIQHKINYHSEMLKMTLSTHKLHKQKDYDKLLIPLQVYSLISIQSKIQGT